MKKSLFPIVFIVLITALFLIPGVGMLFFGPSAPGANEIQSKAPALKNESGKINPAILADTEKYVSDHFFLRQELINVHNRVVSDTFGVSSGDSVILGSDGWLYYASTLDDYTGIAPLSRRELFCAANNLRLMQEYVNSQGADFLFVCVPNKNTVYPGNMPNYGAVSDVHDYERLFKLLDELNISYLDLASTFIESGETLYFAHDSHWNSKGAALAADTINAAFGHKTAYFADGFVTYEPHNGDLFEMLYPTSHDEEQNPVYGGDLEISYEGGGTRPDSITIQTRGAGDTSLLAFRDSFGNLLYPYLGHSYDFSRFSRATAYDLTQISAIEADHVLIELVERNLAYLTRYSPVFPAPVRDAEIPQTVSGKIDFEASTASASLAGFSLIKGNIEFDFEPYSPVYIVCTDGQVFEATTLQDGGFSAYISDDLTAAGIMVYVNGSLCYFE